MCGTSKISVRTDGDVGYDFGWKRRRNKQSGETKV